MTTSEIVSYAALHCDLRHCGVRKSTPRFSGLVRLASGTICEVAHSRMRPFTRGLRQKKVRSHRLINETLTRVSLCLSISLQNRPIFVQREVFETVKIGFAQRDLKVFRAPCRRSGAAAKTTV